MPQSENHATVKFGRLIADVSRISAVSTVSAIGIAHDFQLKIGLSWHSFDVSGLSFVIPEENFCQSVTSKIIVVRTKECPRFGVLQAHDHLAIDNVFALIILPASKQSYGKLIAACACVDFV